MKAIDDEFLKKLENNMRKIELEQKVNWDGDEDHVFQESDDISKYIISATIDKKLEGNLGVSVVDKATVTVDNSSGNFSPKNLNGKWSGRVIPKHYTEITAGIDTDKMTIFDGIIEKISPSYDSRKATISIKDQVSILQNTNCPTDFYEYCTREDIIKTWLDQVGIAYSSDSIDFTGIQINASFEGKTMWQAIQELANSIWASVYIDNGVFFFKTRLSPIYEGENEPVYEFSTHNNSNNENIFKIDEEYTSQNLYNEVKVTSKPLVLQPMQPIWTGADKNQEISEEYTGDKIVNNQLQFTYIPEGSTIEEPTKNVPIVEGGINILDITTDKSYKVGAGIKSVNYETGLITFEDNEEFTPPASTAILQVKYNYNFNHLIPGGVRDFYIDLDEPATEIQNLSVIGQDLNDPDNTITVSFTDPNADIFIEQIKLDSYKRVKVKIENRSSYYIGLKGELNGQPKNSIILMGRPFKRTNVFEVTEKDEESCSAFGLHIMPAINNDFITSEIELKRLVQYLLYQYSTPKSKLNISTKGLPHLSLGDKVRVVQKYRDIDNEFIIKSIKHKFNNGLWDMDLELEQAQPSDWVYTEKGTPILAGISGSKDQDYTPPSDVSGLNLLLLVSSPHGANRVKINWDANNTHDLSYYNIYRKDPDNIKYNHIATVNKGTEYYIDSSLDYNKTYYYLVTAVDTYGNESDSTSAMTDGVETRSLNTPPTPTFSPDDCKFNNNITLVWNLFNDSVKYEVRMGDDSNFFNNIVVYFGAEARCTFENPTIRNYCFQIKSINDNGVYSSETDSISLENKKPNTPAQPNVIPFFESLWIEPKPVLDEDILGYKIYITDNLTTDTTVIDIATPQKVTFNAGSGKTFTIGVSAYDFLGEGDKSSPLEQTTTKISDITQFASELRPPKIVSELPNLPDSAFPDGSSVVLNSGPNKGKLYICDGVEWVSKVTEAESAQNAVLAATVEAGAIGADQIKAGEIAAEHIGSNKIITEYANIHEGVIEDGHINNLNASKIDAGVIDAARISIGASSSFDENYDPSTKETPEGAQSKADTAKNETLKYILDNKSFINGISVGGILKADIIINQFAGAYNPGEVDYNPKPLTFIHPNGNNYMIDCKDGTATNFEGNVTGWSYLAFVGNDTSRFDHITDPNFGKEIVAIRYNNDQWEYCDNYDWFSFVPNENDCIVAKIEKWSDTSNGIEEITRYASQNVETEDSVNTKIQEAKDELNNDITDLYNDIHAIDGYINVTFHDGIIEESEAKAIETYLNQIESENTDLVQRYNNIYNNYYLMDAAIKTTLFNAKSDYDIKYANLFNSINTAIMDGKTTTAEKSDVDSKFSEYKSSLSNLTDSLEKAIDNIGDEKSKAFANAHIIDSSKTTLLHFDDHLTATNGIAPESGYVVTLRPNEGKFDGAVAVEEGTTNILSPEIDTTMKTLTGWVSTATINGDGSITFAPSNWYYMTSATNGFCIGKFAPNDKISFQVEYFLNPEDIPNGTTHLYFAVRFAKSDTTTVNYLTTFTPLADINYGQWTKLVYENFNVAVESHSLALLVYFVGATETGTIKVRNVQVEVKPFATSFVERTRADGVLNYGDISKFFPLDQQTVLMWVNGSEGCFGVSQDWAMAFSVSPAFYLGWESQTKLRISISNANKIQDYLDYTGITFHPNTWYQVGYIFDHGTLKLIINGEVQATKTITPTITYNRNDTEPRNLYLGSYHESGKYRLEGLIDEVFISKIAHTKEEIKSWYEIGKPFHDSNPKIIVPNMTSVSIV